MDTPDLRVLRFGIPLHPLPSQHQVLDESVPHAPVRSVPLGQMEIRLSLSNALRYFPKELHQLLSKEFYDELKLYGHIYMYRFLPKFRIKAYPIDAYPAKCKVGAALMLMIMNNLDEAVAQYPQELVTYGGNGQVFSNWAQFWLTMKYLSEMTELQTLVMYSGHPMGLFPSPASAPRAVVTNGMVVPNYSERVDYDRMFALGVSMYGQMTAGSYCYIGPQGIVHGTTLTIMNAGRLYLSTNDLTKKVYVTSGLGGMSGAQAKAAVICGCIAVIAEVDESALNKRFEQGWLMQKVYNLDDVISSIKYARDTSAVVSIGYLGNVVDLWEKLVEHYEATGELLVDLGSDQTSLHNPFSGGYIPAETSFSEAKDMMHKSSEHFKLLVQNSLRRHVVAINSLCNAGMHFWDYGNSFLLEADRAGADVLKDNPASRNDFKYPSYVQDIMGDIFSLGFGPFRWICTSGLPEDLKISDEIAAIVLKDLIRDPNNDKDVIEQYNDNLKWITKAGEQKMVVGSQARILYTDQLGRVKIALALNDSIKSGLIKAPVVISRDHHDVSGTDSPYRETSNIYDGSAFCADMAVQNAIGDSFRGASWVAIHNGGGVGWGEAINGGFGLLLDGSKESGERARSMLNWDVSNGVARRGWARNERAERAIRKSMRSDPQLVVTMPSHVDDVIFERLRL